MHASPEADHAHQVIDRFQENLDTIHPSQNMTTANYVSLFDML
jgi:hypothetical protein